MLNWIFGRDLKKVLTETKKITVKGIRFEIKRVNLLNYLDGSKVLFQHYDTYKTKGAAPELPPTPGSEKKMRDHYKEVLVAGVAHPKLVNNPEDDGIPVDELFIDWDLVQILYLRILEFTYGKKKVAQLISHAKSS